jgi:hypothetical protein
MGCSASIARDDGGGSNGQPVALGWGKSCAATPVVVKLCPVIVEIPPSFSVECVSITASIAGLDSPDSKKLNYQFALMSRILFSSLDMRNCGMVSTW